MNHVLRAQDGKLVGPKSNIVCLVTVIIPFPNCLNPNKNEIEIEISRHIKFSQSNFLEKKKKKILIAS